jgi:hypothetical protein
MKFTQALTLFGLAAMTCKSYASTTSYVTLQYIQPGSTTWTTIFSNYDPKENFSYSVESFETENLMATMACYEIVFSTVSGTEFQVGQYAGAYGNELVAYPARWVNYVNGVYVC